MSDLDYKAMYESLDRLTMDRIRVLGLEQRYLAEQVRNWIGRYNDCQPKGNLRIIMPGVDELLHDAEQACNYSDEDDEE